MSEEARNPNQPKKQMSLGNKLVLGLLALIVCTFIYAFSNSDSSTDSFSSTTYTTEDAPITSYDVSWIPSGFSGYPEDDNIAWRWGTSSETNCTYDSSSCWSVMVITRDGCPTGIYAELSILDKSEVQIDFTNDSTSAVLSNSKVKLTFDTFNEEADTARIGEIRCS